MKKLGAILTAILIVALVWNTGDILLRRWVWDQVPTQVNTSTVYGLLACNFGFLFFILRKYLVRKT